MGITVAVKKIFDPVVCLCRFMCICVLCAFYFCILYMCAAYFAMTIMFRCVLLHINTIMVCMYTYNICYMPPFPIHSELRHPYIVSLLGVCSKPPNLLILTEFMPRGSLH